MLKIWWDNCKTERIRVLARNGKRSDELDIGKGEIHSISEMKKMLEVIKW